MKKFKLNQQVHCLTIEQTKVKNEVIKTIYEIEVGIYDGFDSLSGYHQITHIKRVNHYQLEDIFETQEQAEKHLSEILKTKMERGMM